MPIILHFDKFKMAAVMADIFPIFILHNISIVIHFNIFISGMVFKSDISLIVANFDLSQIQDGCRSGQFIDFQHFVQYLHCYSWEHIHFWYDI